LTTAHTRGDLARALVEGIALDVDRSLRHLAPHPQVLVAAGRGRGSETDLWLRVLGATTGRPIELRASAETAAAGACRLAALATDAPFEVASFNGDVGRLLPVAEEVEGYRRLRHRLDGVAASVVALVVADEGDGADGGAADP
jgi:sugar (pentulose or hexulose) kinase